MIFNFLGLAFILFLLYVNFKVLTYGKRFNGVKEPSIDRILLDKMNIAKMTIDVPNILVIGR